MDSFTLDDWIKKRGGEAYLLLKDVFARKTVPEFYWQLANIVTTVAAKSLKAW
jgi:hypothetical protein